HQVIAAIVQVGDRARMLLVALRLEGDMVAHGHRVGALPPLDAEIATRHASVQGTIGATYHVAAPGAAHHYSVRHRIGVGLVAHLSHKDAKWAVALSPGPPPAQVQAYA